MKDLEKEYISQITDEVPDLWDRIEAGVDKYEVEKQNDNTEETKKVINFPGRKITGTVIRYGALAACVLLVALSIRLGTKSKSISNDSSPAAESAAMTDSAAADSDTPSEYESEEALVPEKSSDNAEALSKALAYIGFENVSEITFEENKSLEDSTAFEAIGDDLLTASFINESGEKCIVFYTLTANIPDIQTVIKADETGELLYINEDLQK